MEEIYPEVMQSYSFLRPHAKLKIPECGKKAIPVHKKTSRRGGYNKD